MPPLPHIAAERLNALDASQRRSLRECAATDSTHLHIEGRNYLSFASNDYLGLRMHPEVIAAGEAALAKYGAGSGASRLVTGNHPLYAPLEAALAEHTGKEAALVFGSGYLANIGVIAALMGEGDLILADKLAHACILDGAKLSGATLKRFRHNDVAHAQALLTSHRGQYRHALIVTESVFSMDGDKAPIADLAALAHAQDAWLMVDDAHGLGAAHMKADIVMGTLSKALGGYGGYVASSRAVIDLLVNHARSFIFSTGLPPATCASALAALHIFHREPERAKRALHHAHRFAQALQLTPAQSAIVPLIVGDSAKAMALSDAFKAQGIWVSAIRPPTVPPGTARLRFTFSAAHTEAEVTQLIAALHTLRP